MAIFYLLPKDQNCISILNAKQKDPEFKLLYGDNSDNLGPSLVTHTICTFFVYTTRPAKTMGFNGSMSFWNIHVNNIYVYGNGGKRLSRKLSSSCKLNQSAILFIKCWLKCCQINEIPTPPNGLQRLSFIYCISGSYLSCIQE